MYRYMYVTSGIYIFHNHVCGSNASLYIHACVCRSCMTSIYVCIHQQYMDVLSRGSLMFQILIFLKLTSKKVYYPLTQRIHSQVKSNNDDDVGDASMFTSPSNSTFDNEYLHLLVYFDFIATVFFVVRKQKLHTYIAIISPSIYVLQYVYYIYGTCFLST